MIVRVKTSQVVSGIIFGTALALVLGWQMFGIFMTACVFAVMAYFIKSTAEIVAIVAGAVSLTGVLVLVWDGMSGIPAVGSVGIVTTFLCALALLGALSRRWRGAIDESPRIGWLLGELPIIIAASALVVRWPIDSPLESFGLLSYEDNAAWISTSSGFLPQHIGSYFDGAGGFVLDPLMYLIRTTSETFGAITESPSMSYLVVARTYAVIEWMAILSVGLGIFHALRRWSPSTSSSMRLTAALGGLGLSYVALQLPRTTGHLTFIGALMFIWAIFLHSTVIFDRPTWSYSALLAIGMMGMWWPLALVVGPLLAIQLAQRVSRTAIVKMWRHIPHWLSALFAALTAALVVVGAGPVTTGFRSMSVREFFSVQGGLQPIPGNSVLIGIGTLMALSLAEREKNDDEHHGRSSWMLALKLIATVSAILYLVANFVGPDFTPKYSVQKLFLLFVLATVPLSSYALVLVITRLQRHVSVTLLIPLVFLVGIQTVGWNLNDPRSPSIPPWAGTLLATADKNPDALVYCTTSDPGRNMEAYLCSRHAAALQFHENELARRWRSLQIAPLQFTEDNQNFLRETATLMEEELSKQKTIILLSLEEGYVVAEEDQWWKSLLPLERTLKIGAK